MAKNPLQNRVKFCDLEEMQKSAGGGMASLQAQIASMLTQIPVVRNAGSIIAAPRIFTGSVPVAAGVAVFDLTDGAGHSILNQLRYAKAEVSDQTISYNYAYAISLDKKTLNVTVYRIQTVSLLGISVLSTAIAAPNGTIVNLFAVAE